MPSLKPDVPTQSSSSANGASDDREQQINCYYLWATQEIFTNYEDYSYKLELLSRPIWECELTATHELTYWTAQEFEELLEYLIINRLPKDLQISLFSPEPVEPSKERARKAELADRIHMEYFHTFFPKELIRFKLPAAKRYRTARIVEQVDVSCLPTNDTSESQQEAAPAHKAYRVQEEDSDVTQIVNSRHIVHQGILRYVRLLPLRLLINKWIGGQQPAYRRDTSKPKIGTKRGLEDLPANFICHEDPKYQPEALRGPLSNVDVGYGVLSMRLLETLNEIPYALVNIVDSPPEPVSAKKPKLDDEAVKYPIEDLDIPIKFQTIAARPDPSLVEDSGFDLAVKLWSFLNSFHSVLDLSPRPLLELLSDLGHSCTSPDNFNRFPIEKVITQLLSMIVSDADTVLNLWIPHGINELSQETLNILGDWRTASSPVMYNQWGRVLLSCIKELHCLETLPQGREIIKLLEKSKPNHKKLSLCRKNFAAAKSRLPALKEEPLEETASEEQLEALIQLRFYDLPLEHILSVLNFLIEQALGTIRLKEYHDETLANIANFRRDRADVVKAAREVQDESNKLDSKSKLMSASYQSLYESTPDPGSSPNSADTPTASRTKSRKEAASLRLAIQKNVGAQVQLSSKEKKLLKRAESLAKDIEKGFQQLNFKPLGEDRYFNRYYLVPNQQFSRKYSATSTYVKLLVEPTLDPNHFRAITKQTHPLLKAKKEGSPICLIWGYYSKESEIKQLIDWLNPKGIREKALKNALDKVKDTFQH